jgi:hypothetical protein
MVINQFSAVVIDWVNIGYIGAATPEYDSPVSGHPHLSM